MDRINTWCRRTILCFALVWSFPAGAGSPEVERIAKEAARHADHTKIVIVGVAHDNERLADELLELLTLLRANDEFDCFFVELPTDLQDEFDGAVNEGDVNRLVQAFYLSRKQPFLLASRKFGYESEAHQAYLSSWLDRATKEASSERLGVNKKLLTYLKENRIPLLPYDADSRSQVMFDTAVFEIRNTFTNAHIPAPDYEMHVAVAKNDDARNLIMAENIISKFASYGCNKAVVEVGANHIATKGNLEWSLGIELDTYTPLQDRLSEKGLPSERVGSLLGQRKR